MVRQPILLNEHSPIISNGMKWLRLHLQLHQSFPRVLLCVVLQILATAPVGHFCKQSYALSQVSWLNKDNKKIKSSKMGCRRFAVPYLSHTYRKCKLIPGLGVQL